MSQFLNLITIEEAMKKTEHGLSSTPVKKVGLKNVTGRILAQDVVSPVNVPPFSRSTMDGYALKAADTYGASESLPVYLEVVGKVEMGKEATAEIASGQAVEIPTGGMLPPGADAVVMVEETEKVAEQEIEVLTAVGKGENIVQCGEDIARGEKLLARGQCLRPQDVGALAGIGIVEVEVFSRPEIAVFSTGDEIIPPADKPAPGQIRDINTYSLGALVQQVGGKVDYGGIIPDQKNELKEKIKQATRDKDMILLSGGSSVGVKDLTIEVLEELQDSGVLVHGIAIKPGKPTIIALLEETLFIGLPGHPTSAMVVFEIVVRPIIERLAGFGEQAAPRTTRVRAELTRNIASSRGRSEYFRVKLRQAEDTLLAEPMLGKSSLISTMVEADGLVNVELGSEGKTKGDLVEVRVF